MTGAAPSSAPVEEGSIIAGKYLVGPTLGEGGMGVVVAARNLQLDQPVALKFLRPEALRNVEVVARFSREARAAAKIQSQHVVRVLDVGTLESGAPFMVMERLEGEDLSLTLARLGRLPIPDAVDYVLQACEGVAEAHALNMVHRDLKPANLFLAKRPGGKHLVKVLDFGISKLPASMDNVSLTRTTGFIGSPPYMSPEQLSASRSVDARSDIWSLGIVLYELLTKRTPFEGQSMPVMIASILHQAPDSPRSRRPDVPAGLDAAVMRCLQLDPEQRFPDVAFLAAAIGPFGSRGGAESVERISHMLHVRQPTIMLTTVSDEEAVAPADPPTADAPAGPAVLAGRRLRTSGKAPPEGQSHARSQARAPVRSQAPRGQGRGVLLALVAVGIIAIAGGIVGTWRTMRSAPRESRVSVAPPGEHTPAAPVIPVATPRPTPATPPAAAAPATSPPEPVERVEVPQPADPEVVAPRSKTLSAPGTKTSAKRPVNHTVSGESKVGPPPVAKAAEAAKRSGSVECARLLERQSLGETLSAAEAAFYKGQCRR